MFCFWWLLNQDKSESESLCILWVYNISNTCFSYLVASSYFVLITAKFHSIAAYFSKSLSATAVFVSVSIAQFYTVAQLHSLVSVLGGFWLAKGAGTGFREVSEIAFELLTQRVLPDHLPKVLPWCGEAYWIDRYESFLQKSNFHFTIMIWLCSPFQRIVLLLHCFNSHNIWQLPPCHTWGMQ